MNTLLKFLGCCLLLLSYSCKQPPVPDTTAVYSLQEIGELATVEYTFAKVLAVNDEGEWYKFGDRKILIRCEAIAKAGFNLKDAKIEVINEKSPSLKIGLPPTQLLSFTMNPDKIETRASSVTGFRQEFSQEEKNRFLQQGEQNIRANIAQSNIYKDAWRNAETFIRAFYKDLGYPNIQIYALEIKD